MIVANYPIVLLFPLTVLCLALAEPLDRSIANRLSFLGDISYSVYLWHFPLQLLFVVVTILSGGTHLFFTTKTSLLLFFVALIAISTVSFRWLEAPAQKYLRAKFAVVPRADH